MASAERHRPCRESGNARCGASEAGFTLFEVLLALMLMALLAGLAMPSLRRPAGPLTLRMAAYDVSALLREARTAAIAGDRSTEAVIHPAASALETAHRRIVLPPGVTLALTGRKGAGVTFAPNGTATGGTILLQTASSQIGVAVEGGTGAIHLVP